MIVYFRLVEEEERMYWEERRRYEEELELYEWHRRYNREPRMGPPMPPPPPPRPYLMGMPPGVMGHQGVSIMRICCQGNVLKLTASNVAFIV
ncbi:hypothetical protein TNCV_1632361 [Trichonephila clavipes]|nr:hypothetical protein TNCV_1632361 [Trichonephila clavipes]